MKQNREKAHISQATDPAEGSNRFVSFISWCLPAQCLPSVFVRSGKVSLNKVGWAKLSACHDGLLTQTDTGAQLRNKKKQLPVSL